MNARLRSQRSYDHRLKELIRTSADPSCATDLGIPISTVMGWVEMYYGRGDHVPRYLEQSRNAASKARLDLNRRTYYAVCPQSKPESSISNSEVAWLLRMSITSYPTN